MTGVRWFRCGETPTIKWKGCMAVLDEDPDHNYAFWKWQEWDPLPWDELAVWRGTQHRENWLSWPMSGRQIEGLDAELAAGISVEITPDPDLEMDVGL